MRTTIEIYLLVVIQPIKITPYLAAVHLFWLFVRVQFAQRQDSFQCRCHVRFVFIGKIMEIDIFRFRRFEYIYKLFDDFFIVFVLNLF